MLHPDAGLAPKPLSARWPALPLSLALLALTACVADNPSSMLPGADAGRADAGVADMTAPDADPMGCVADVRLDLERIDFPPTPAFDTRTVSVTVTNAGACPVILEQLTLNGARTFNVLVDGRDPRRQPEVLDDPDVDGQPGLGPGARFTIQVRFTPTDDTPTAGELNLVFSDDLELSVPLTGNRAGPCIAVEPPVLEFTSGVNESQTAEITVTSCGAEPVTVQSAVFAEDGSGAFTLVAERSAALPFDLAPADSPGGTSLRLTVRFQPDQPGAVNSRLRITGVGVPPREVRLVGRAQENACPVAIFPPEPIFADVGAAVALDGSASRDPDGPDGRPVAWRWVAVELPEGATTQVVEALFDANRPSGGGPMDDAETPTAIIVPDVAGQYRLKLAVTDVEGLTSTACNTDADVVIRAGVERRVVVQLTWLTPADLNPEDANGADVDLLLRHGELFCSPADPTPDWPPAGPANNPVYDADDTARGGPENIILVDPIISEDPYEVRVIYDDDGGLGPSVATVRVFVDDRLLRTESFELLGSGDEAGFEFTLP